MSRYVGHTHSVCSHVNDVCHIIKHLEVYENVWEIPISMDYSHPAWRRAIWNVKEQHKDQFNAYKKLVNEQYTEEGIATTTRTTRTKNRTRARKCA